MLSTKEIVIVGSTAPDVVKLISAINRHGSEKFVVKGFLDDDVARHGMSFFGLPVLGSTQLLEHEYAGMSVINNVARSMSSRDAVVQKLRKLGVTSFPSLIHPWVDTSYAHIGNGCIIQEGVTLGPGCVIGDHCIIYAHATIGHESLLADTIFVANNAVVGARSSVGRGVFIGLNAVIFPAQAVGSWSTIGAGSVALKSVDQGVTVFGNPARRGVLPVSS